MPRLIKHGVKAKRHKMKKILSQKLIITVKSWTKSFKQLIIITIWFKNMSNNVKEIPVKIQGLGENTSHISKTDRKTKVIKHLFQCGYSF